MFNPIIEDYSGMILPTVRIGSNYLVRNAATGSYEISENHSTYRLNFEQAQTLIYYYKRFLPKFPVKDWLGSLRPFVRRGVKRLSIKF
jgi:hypothetical protein